MRLILFCTMVLCSLTLNLQAAEKNTVPSYEDELFRLRLIPRTPEQMAAFYEARGFPAAMISELTQHCFFTVVIKNKSKSLVWLDLSQWHFMAGAQEIRRIPRGDWSPKWVAMEIPLSAQSTFRWTLLPEKLDFQPDEHEGGNIILARTKERFSLRAKFSLGEAGQDGVRVARIDNLECASLPGGEGP
jgi:hypothetical protein